MLLTGIEMQLSICQIGNIDQNNVQCFASMDCHPYCIPVHKLVVRIILLDQWFLAFLYLQIDTGLWIGDWKPLAMNVMKTIGYEHNTENIVSGYLLYQLG